MALLKCKMCGGDVELTADKTFGTCEYCGCSMTFPKVDEDEQRTAAFNRGNHFRRIGEFDKALQVYERIVRENEEDAEAHWCCALCRFGIEYVEDPTTFEWLPTCHRASFDSFLEDVDYLAAVEHSEGITRRQYQKDAAKIAEVQRGILATSQNTEPFDVFICYKESDENGDRTRDSLLAQDIYYQLTEQGRKVFFARITLEDMVGKQYEPYIFAALNSAKVMVVVGTKPEHLSAVWVKNEWSRFLAMMKADHSKLLLPCYRDMDPYDMPEQLSVLQSYDMSKIGFIQDLTRGISKVLDASAPKVTVVEQSVSAPAATNIAPLLKRAFMFLEDGEWSRADEFCEQVLNIDPECAEAYLGKLMAELHVKKQESLKDCAEPFDGRNNYQKALRFADNKLKTALAGYVEYIKERNETARLEGIYNRATSMMNKASTESAYKEAASVFESISEYKDSADLAEKCRELGRENTYNKAASLMASAKTESDYNKVASLFQSFGDYRDAANLAQECLKMAEIARKDAVLSAAKIKMFGNRISLYEEAIRELKKISGWRDADDQILACQNKIDEIKAAEEVVRQEKERQAQIAREQAEKKAKLIKKIAIITTSIVAAVIVFVIILNTVIMPEAAYKKAVELENAGEYYKAAVAFAEMGDYKDAAERSMALWDDITMRDTLSAGAFHTVALRVDGSVMAAGTGAYGQCDVGNWTNIVAVSAGSHHTVGLNADGTVVADGDNSSKQCNVYDWRNIVAISAGDYHTVGLKADGTVVAVGSNYNGQCDVANWRNIVAISASKTHTVGLKADGTVVAVGSKSDGQCDVQKWKNIVAVSAGNNHTVGLKADGTVVAVGLNTSGQCDMANWSNIVAISAGTTHTVGLKADGTVVAVGSNYNGQCDVANWSNIVAISASRAHTVGLKADGTVVAVGLNANEQCNVQDWKDIRLPK